MSRPRRACFLLLLLLTGCTLPKVSTAPDGSPAPAAGAIPRLRHVVVVVLENASYEAALANADVAATAREGALLRRYYGIAHHSLPNYLALASGATPTDTTRADCPKFNCALNAPSIATQLESAKLSWKGYFGATTEPCRTPVPGHSDPYLNGYLTHHNPFAYYPAVGANPDGGTASCRSHLRPLNELGDDAGSGQLPNFALVIADSCDDGHDGPCRDGRPGGVTSAGAWMRRTLATVTGSAGWTTDSLLVITFDEGAALDSSGCCGEQIGGGHLATLLISPLIRGGTVSDHDYDHYSALRTVEDGMGLDRHLAAAGDPQVSAISDVWSAPPSPQPSR